MPPTLSACPDKALSGPNRPSLCFELVWFGSFCCLSLCTSLPASCRVLNLPGQFTLSKRSSELWPAQERLIQCPLHLKPKGLCVRVSQPTHVHTNGRVQRTKWAFTWAVFFFPQTACPSTLILTLTLATIVCTGTGYILGGAPYAQPVSHLL